MRRLFAILSFAGCLMAAGSARAWANAQVSSATAHVRVEADGRLGVRFELRVRVLGGWLTELEIAGLDRPLALDGGMPSSFVRATSEPVPFDAIADEAGRVVFRFQNGRAPRVGEYIASFGYTSVLAADAVRAAEDDRVRYAWTFPSWAAGLDSVDLEIDAPAAALAAPADEGGMGAATTVESRDGRTRLVFHRSYLPRGVAWPVAFSLPRESVPAAMRPPAANAPRVATVAATRAVREGPLLRIALAVFVLVALAKRLLFARLARKAEAVPVPLVPLSTPFAALAILGSGLLAAKLARSIPEAALAACIAILALVVQRPARRASTGRLGSFRTATHADRRRARWDEFVSAIDVHAWFDATRILGFGAFTSIAFVILRRHLASNDDPGDSVFSTPHLVALLFVLFLVSSRHMVPTRAHARLRKLETVARSLMIPEGSGRGLGLSLTMHRDVRDVAQDARIRFVADHRAAGLVRLDVAIVERATLGGFVARPVVLVVVRQGSDAERILVRYAGASSMRTAPGGRRARVLPLTRTTFTLLDRLTEANEPAQLPVASKTVAKPLPSAALHV